MPIEVLPEEKINEIVQRICNDNNIKYDKRMYLRFETGEKMVHSAKVGFYQK